MEDWFISPSLIPNSIFISLYIMEDLWIQIYKKKSKKQTIRVDREDIESPH